MNVKELKAKLDQYPEDMEVMIEMVDDEFQYGLLKTVEVRAVTFQADEDEDLVSDQRLILSDEP